MVEKFKSNKSSLAKIVYDNLQFNIPIYQRLYVWDNDIVKVFLTDLKNAFLEDNQKEYFIGSIVYVKNGNNVYDLIDGQQRNTTLWLISNVLGHELDKFAFVDRENMRLKFSIREKVTSYFNYLRHTRSSNIFEDFEDEKDLINISKAYIQIMAFIENEENNLFDKKKEFAHFIFHKVKLICTEVPPETDLTKLFEVINARGVQLRQDEILKAKLLSIINRDPEQKHKAGNLSKLWEACADMSSYVAFNLKNQLSNDVNWKSLLSDEERVEESNDIKSQKFSSAFFKNFIEDLTHNSHDENKTFSLVNLLLNDQPIDGANTSIENLKEDTISSIISFPMLLLHALRIFLREKNCQDISFFSEKKLITTFETALLKNKELLKDDRNKMSNIIIDFLECLWNVKVIFDDTVLKWVSHEKEKELKFVKLYFTKSKDAEYPKLDTLQYNSFTALQAMLYHSQEMITQYWLTPYLYYHFKNSSQTEIDSFKYLRKLDNILFSSILKKGDLKERTLQLMIDLNSQGKSSFNTQRFLSESNNELGVKFPHYWFYKLEYVLYYEFFRNDDFLMEFNKDNPNSTKYKSIDHKDLWKAYRMTAKNSVEHISPQNPSAEKDLLCKTMLNHFGNLALVTRSINSSYSNNSFDMKRVKFFDNIKNDRIDALKLYLIYYNWDETTWEDSSSEKHQNDMTLILENYFKANV